MAINLFDTWTGGPVDINAHNADSPATAWVKHANASKIWKVVNGRLSINASAIQGVSYHNATIANPLAQWLCFKIADTRTATGTTYEKMGVGALVSTSTFNGYFIAVEQDQSSGNVVVRLNKWETNASTFTAKAAGTINSGVAATYKVAVKITSNAGNPRFRVWVNGIQEIDFTDTASPYLTGKTGVFAYDGHTTPDANNNNNLCLDAMVIADAVTLTPDATEILKGETTLFTVTGVDTKFTTLSGGFVLESAPAGCSIASQGITSESVLTVSLTAGTTSGDIVLRETSTGEIVTITVTDWPAPTPPTLSAGTITHNSAVLSWAGGSSGLTYQLHRSEVDGFTPSGVTEVLGATATPHTDTPLAPSTTYYYKVVGTNLGGVSAESNQVTVITDDPPPATGVVITGPTSAIVGESISLTVQLTPAQSSVPAPVNVLLNLTNAIGALLPAAIELTTATPSVTVTFDPSAVGVTTVETTNDGSLTEDTHSLTVISIPKILEVPSDTAAQVDLLYAQVFDDYGRIWDGTEFVSRNVSNWADYLIAPTEPVPAVYRWSIPTDATTGRWLRIYQLATAETTPSEDDLVQGDYEIPMRASVTVDAASIKADAVMKIQNGLSTYDPGTNMVDGVTYESAFEAAIAFMFGKVSVTDNGDGTSTYSFKKRNGTTVKLTVIANDTTGARTTSTIL